MVGVVVQLSANGLLVLLDVEDTERKRRFTEGGPTGRLGETLMSRGTGREVKHMKKI
jgi:hypothetical protein